eukprot:Tbor_TRINITY_DN5155_c0_g1::TRINITY_DN5155_c0_g1_i3::g.26256::m.26256/K03164/TOP2; DNA topoisomerase II
MPPKKQKIAETNVDVGQAIEEASERYRRVSHIEHVLLRPEMYIGSMEHHLLPKVPLLKPEVEPILLPKLLKAGKKFDKAFIELNGGPSVTLSSFVEESESPLKQICSDDEVPHSSDEFDENQLDNDVVFHSAAETIVDSFADKDEECVPVIDGKILGVDVKLCDTSGKYNAEKIIGPGSFYYRDVWVNPGLLKIFDEVLMNAADNRLSNPTDGATSQTFIKVLFDKETGRITVSNDGNGIPIVKHKDHNLWIPEMIFGHLLTSSHYENDPESVAAGRHGYGAKLTNIMSSEFTVTCHWKDKVFIGKWSDNMQKCDINVSSREYSNESFTEVSFVPEYDRFMVEDLKKRAKYEAELSKKRENDRLLQATKKKMVEMYGEKESKIAIKLLQKKKSDDIKNTLADGVIPADFNIRDELFCIVQKRCLDLAASIGSTQKVYFNDVCLTPRVFSDYCRMHFPEEEIARQPFYTAEKEFELGILFQPKTAFKRSFCHVSLVNGLVTSQGGSHLNHAQSMVDKVLSEVADILKAKARVLFNVTLFKSNYVFFVNATVHQPKFDSQSKAKLVSKHSFPELDLSGLKDHILSLPFLNEFCTSANLVDASFLNIELRKIKDKFNSRGITKLVEPSTIGNPNYNHVLILTEGDSAKALAVNSLSLEQRKIYGVFPLRGKVLNVRTHPLKKLIENVEVMNVFAAIGLTIGEKYESLKKLRYKKILIMTDQDQDGMHIRGLLMNLFQVLWPQLLAQNPGFISIFSTPLVKARISSNVTEEFYSTRQYDEWRESVDPKVLKSAKIRYYKGLGTSTSDEGRQYFRSIDNNTTEVLWNKDPAVDNNVLHNMFSDTTTDVRKRKMIGYVPTKDSFCEERRGTVESFVEKDLMKYAIYDNSRSIVSGLDGLKTSTRKVLWALLKRDPPSMRVSQLAGYVSEVSNYHHGEKSLHGVIINMAQDYTTSNNINLLLPEGQFGSRLGGGADFAAPRYIFTKLSSFARLLFPKIDDAFLEYRSVDGDTVEPFSYAPIIPFALVNAVTSIGYGMYCHIPSYHPMSIIDCTKRLLNGESASEVYQPNSLSNMPVGFRGSIKQYENQLYYTGKIDIYDGDSKIAPNTLLPKQLIIRVTELPPRLTSSSFITFVRNKFGRYLVYIRDFCGGDHIDVELAVDSNFLMSHMQAPSEESILEVLGLYSPVQSISGHVISGCSKTIVNMSLITIVEDHFRMRLSVYEKRYEALIKSYKREIKRMDSIIRFTELITKDLSLLRLSEAQLSKKLRKEGIYEADGADDGGDVKETGNTVLETLPSNGYSYLTKRPMSSLLKMNLDSFRERLKASQEKLVDFEKNVTVKDLWLKDLNALETEFLRFEKKKNASISNHLSQRKMNRAITEALTKQHFHMMQLLPSFCPEKKSVTNIYDIFRYEMEKQGWDDVQKWNFSKTKVKKRQIQQKREERIHRIEAKKAIIAARRAQLQDKRILKLRLQNEIRDINENKITRHLKIQKLREEIEKIFEGCSLDSNGSYILTESVSAQLEDIYFRRRLIQEDIDIGVFNDEGKGAVVVADQINVQPTEVTTPCDNMIQDAGVSAILNESRRIDSFIDNEVDPSMNEIYKADNAAGIEPGDEKQTVIDTTPLKSKQRSIRITKTKLAGNRALRGKEKKRDDKKRNSFDKRAPDAEPPKKTQKQVRKPSIRQSKEAGKRTNNVPDTRIRRVAAKKVTQIEIVGGEPTTELVSKHPVPFATPFSAMTAPLSLAIRPADTFALINAALAHSVFTRRQHMTAFVTQRVGTLGAPVLGRLVSRFVF